MKQLFVLFAIVTSLAASAQFTTADSLRGGYGHGRDWWDITHYDLSVKFDIPSKTISGVNVMRFSLQPAIKASHATTGTMKVFQIDLQDPMVLDSVVIPYKKAIPGSSMQHIGGAYLMKVPDNWLDWKGGEYEITVYFHGSPKEAQNAPWDGGILWKTDKSGNPWVTVACQGLGASVWFPCKDSQIDEPDSVSMHYTCDSKLVCVSNGRFEGRKDHSDGTSTFTWEVMNPINNYCMIPYIGDYVNLHEHYLGERGTLELDYWVIRGNEEKAQKHFKEAPRTLEALEYWFGPYPFYEDGYKLVEAPHLGMEHQSAVAYGNGYRNGYLGRDLSGTGEGLRWDFIIVHESGHEWFGNNITTRDIADMWVHESFTNYSETLFTDYWFGKEAGAKYVRGLRKNIANDIPVIGPYGVNREGSGDMYYKGANMLHTIRQLVASDSVFRMMLREMNVKFYHDVVETRQIEQFMSDYLGMDLDPVFDQYLRAKNPPTLQLKYGKKKLKYRWTDCVKGFNMPVDFENYGRVTPSRKWQKLVYTDKGEPIVDPDFYLWIKSNKK